MTLIKCKECGAEVSPKAKNCPSCGIQVTSKPFGCLAYIVIIFLGLIFIVVIVGLFSGPSAKSDDYSSSAIVNPKSAKIEQDCINEMFFNAAPGVTARYEMRQEIYTYCKSAAINGVK